MLFAGCNGCQRVVPLFCAGQFLPHVPMAAIGTPLGVGCQMCGIVPPIFTCTYCMTVQMYYLQSAGISPQQAAAQRMQLAPVVQAAPDTEGSVVQDMMRGAAKGFAREAGKQLAAQLLPAFFGG